MSRLLDYLSMGKYGFFVWGSYFAALIIIVFFIIQAYKNTKTAEQFVKRYLRRKGIK